MKDNSFTATWIEAANPERPFLRRGTEWLLRAREGWCGEGTRVMVNLLGRLGFDATRVTLYDAQLRAVHTLVSIRVGGAGTGRVNCVSVSAGRSGEPVSSH